MKLSRIITRILLRTHSVDNVLRAFNKAQQRLAKQAQRLRTLAAEEEAAAQRALDAAKVASAEAERAVTVADRLRDLTTVK